ncbi:MAG: hypothetical protein E6H54_04910 [Betaproteobacteria bacterium]|nr:MAG: hypothetical protein E6H54_04910 [Betaproteobacteria bacterium]
MRARARRCGVPRAGRARCTPRAWRALTGAAPTLRAARAPRRAARRRRESARRSPIKRNVDHQTRLIDDLLDTSRIVSGKLTIERRVVNLVDTVHAALDAARPARRRRPPQRASAARR